MITATMQCNYHCNWDTRLFDENRGPINEFFLPQSSTIESLSCLYPWRHSLASKLLHPWSNMAGSIAGSCCWWLTITKESQETWYTEGRRKLKCFLHGAARPSFPKSFFILKRIITSLEPRYKRQEKDAHGTVKPTRTTIWAPHSSRAHWDKLQKNWDSCLQKFGQAPSGLECRLHEIPFLVVCNFGQESIWFLLG